LIENPQFRTAALPQLESRLRVTGRGKQAQKKSMVNTAGMERRARLAELEVSYTKEKPQVDAVQTILYRRLAEH
jgi:hypothetical protein